jgi:hypothetical protein
MKSIILYKIRGPDMIAHACNPATQETDKKDRGSRSVNQKTRVPHFNQLAEHGNVGMCVSPVTGGSRWEDCSRRPATGKNLRSYLQIIKIQKRSKGVAWVEDNLPSKLKALSSNFSNTKQKKTNKKIAIASYRT